MGISNLFSRFFRSSPSVSKAFSQHVAEIEAAIHYRFDNTHLLELALTHSSYTGHQNKDISYERLEFLGDAVLQLAVSHYLYDAHPHLNEGTLTKYRTILVNGSYLSDCANDLELGKWIQQNASTNRSQTRESNSIKEDVIEALIAAIYLDGGYDQAARWIRREIIGRKPHYEDELQSFNYKGQLTERCQRLKLGHPVYEVTKISGPDHDRLYVIQVLINNMVVGFGEGHSKKEASQHASEDTLKNWDVFFPDKH